MTVNKKLISIYFLMLGLELLILIFVMRHHNWSLTPYLDGNDTLEYSAIAKNLVVNHSFSKSLTSPFVPNFFRLPAYPFWLAFIYWLFGSFKPAVFLGMIVFALSGPLIYLIMREVFSEKLAFFSALIFALEPRMAFSAPFLLSEQIFLPVFLMAILLAVKFFNDCQKKYVLLFSAILGFLALLKMIVFYLWPFVAILFYVGLRKKFAATEVLKIILSGTLIFLIVLMPWFLRNKIVLGTWQLSSGGGLVIYWGHLEILERYLGTPQNMAYQKLIDRADKLVGPDLETVGSARVLSREAMSEIKNNFPLYLKIYFSNLPLFFITDGYKGIASYTSNTSQNYINFSDLLLRLQFENFFGGLKKFSFSSIFWPILGRSVWLILTGLSFWGIFLSIKTMPSKRLALIMFCFLILYFAILTGPIGFDPRYRMPVNGFLISFALAPVFKVFKKEYKYE